MAEMLPTPQNLSWKYSSYLGVSGKLLSSSFPRDYFPVTSGTEGVGHDAWAEDLQFGFTTSPFSLFDSGDISACISGPVFKMRLASPE